MTTRNYYHKDWVRAIIAGFDYINSHRGCRTTPTDDFLEGMARDLESQKDMWLRERERKGFYRGVYDGDSWVIVTNREADNIERRERERADDEAAEIKAKAEAKQIHFLDGHGWPVERIKGRRIQNFLRLLIHTRKIKRGPWQTQQSDSDSCCGATCEPVGTKDD